MKNEGIHTVDVSGTIRIFSKVSGLRVFIAPLSVLAVPPGATRAALANSTWLPPAQGEYYASGEVTCYQDGVPLNDTLGSTPFTVTPPPPPPPPPPATHATTHEDGGADELNVDGLKGTLATPQPIEAHATDHENGGPDELNVEGLKGKLADPQTVAEHGNEQHTTPFASQASLTTHANASSVHTFSTNLQQTDQKGAANGYAPLDADALVPVANLPALAASRAVIEFEEAVTDGVEVVVLCEPEPPAPFSRGRTRRVSASGVLAPTPGGCTLRARIIATVDGSPSPFIVGESTVAVPGDATNDTHWHLCAIVCEYHALSGWDWIRSPIQLCVQGPPPGSATVHGLHNASAGVDAAVVPPYRIGLTLTVVGAGSAVFIHNGAIDLGKEGVE